MTTTASTKRRSRGKPVPETLAGVSDALTLIGVVAASVALFLHGWVHVTVMFAPRNSSGLLQRLGAEVDRQIAAIGEQEVNAAISPTLWLYRSHAFQALFALLLLVATAVLFAPSLPPRWRVRTRAGALLMSLASAIVVAFTFARIQDRIAALPERITAAMQSNVAIRQSLALTNGVPRVSGGPGWPMIVVAAGVLLALIGTLAGLIVTLKPSQRPYGKDHRESKAEPRGLGQ